MEGGWKRVRDGTKMKYREDGERGMDEERHAGGEGIAM